MRCFFSAVFKDWRALICQLVSLALIPCMQPEDIGRSYDEIAQRWLEPHLETNGISQHELALRFGAHAGGRALDVSARMIALARERLPHLTFHQADVCEWRPEGRYDFISAWDSLWHVPLARHAEVLAKLCQALAPGGIFIFTFGGLDAPEERQDASMGVPVHYSTLGVSQTLQTVAAAGCVCRHLEYDQHPEMHVFAVVQRV